MLPNHQYIGIKLVLQITIVDLSVDLKRIIRYCLSHNPEDRQTITDICRHSWMSANHDEPAYVTSDVPSDWSSVMLEETRNII